MANEKVIVAIIRIRDANDREKTLPIGFKIVENEIPSEVKPDRLHSSNLCQIQISGHKAIPAMIVCIGDDSMELITLYSAFCERMKAKKIPGLANKINHWLSIKNIILIKQSGSKMESCTSKEFESFIQRAESLLKQERAIKDQHVSPKGKKQQAKNDSSSSIGKSAAAQNLTKSSSGYSSENVSVSSFLSRDSTTLEDTGSENDLINSTMDHIKKFQALTDGLSSYEPNRLLFMESSRIYMNLLKLAKNIEGKFSNKEYPHDSGFQYSCDLRIIEEEDGTYSKGDTTFIEGSLPVRSSKYKKAISALSNDIQDREPSNVITTLLKMCFPDHWVSGVTLKGQGGKKSLLHLWNYEDPLSNPCCGSYNNQLGFERFRALINHTMRKCGRKSYDLSTEKHLSSVLAKAIHYKRTKKSSSKGWDKLDGESSDEDQIYISDREADKEDYEDADEYRLPKPKNRKIQTPFSSPRRGRNSSFFTRMDQPASTSKVSGIVIPELVKMVIELSPPHENENDQNQEEEKENDDNDSLDDGYANIETGDSNEIQPDSNSNVSQSALKQKEVGSDEKKIIESEKIETQSENTKLQDEESFHFDDDEDDFLKDLNVDDENADDISLGSTDKQEIIELQKNNQYSNEESQERKDKKEQKSSIDEVDIISSTPIKDKPVYSLNLKVSPIAAELKLDSEVTESAGSESRDSNSNSRSGKIDSYFPKRKVSSLFNTNSAFKKCKKTDKESEQEKTNMEESQGSDKERSKIVENQKADFETIDPVTLSFLSNPANAALLKRLISRNQEEEAKKD